jgi:hypothetical protein
LRLRLILGAGVTREALHVRLHVPLVAKRHGLRNGDRPPTSRGPRSRDHCHAKNQPLPSGEQSAIS